MTRMKLSGALLAATVLTGSAWAQTSTPPMSTPSTPPAASPAAPSSGATATQLQAGQWLSSKMPGVDVYNSANEKIGDISELVLDKDGKVSSIVVSVGGFLGMGKHDVAIPFADVKFMSEPVRAATAAPSATGMPSATSEPATTGTVRTAPGATAPVTPAAAAAMPTYPDHAVINMTADQLKALPAFKYGR